MAVTMTNEQLAQLLASAKYHGSFTNCMSRYDGSRDSSKVEAFIHAIQVFKNQEKITDADAIIGLPMLLEGTASVWWQGVKATARTWDDAIKALRSQFAPRKPAYQIYIDVFATKQTETEPTDIFIYKKRELLAQLSTPHKEEIEIDIVYGLLNLNIRKTVSRDDISTFEKLIEKARRIEQINSERPTNKNHHKSSLVNRRCNFCHRPGHVIEECRKKLNSGRPNQYESSQPTCRPVQDIIKPTNSNVSCYGCGMPGMFRSNCPQCKPKIGKTTDTNVQFYSTQMNSIGRNVPVVKLQINGLNGMAYLDTCARTSVASASLYQHLVRQGCTFRDVLVDLTLADGISKITKVMVTDVQIKLQGKFITTSMVTLPDATDNRTLLGIDFLEKAGIIINAPQQAWYFIHNPAQWYNYSSITNMVTINSIQPRNITPQKEEYSMLPPQVPPIRLTNEQGGADVATQSIESDGSPATNKVFKSLFIKYAEQFDLLPKTSTCTPPKLNQLQLNACSSPDTSELPTTPGNSINWFDMVEAERANNIEIGALESCTIEHTNALIRCTFCRNKGHILENCRKAVITTAAGQHTATRKIKNHTNRLLSDSPTSSRIKAIRDELKAPTLISPLRQTPLRKREKKSTRITPWSGQSKTPINLNLCTINIKARKDEGTSLSVVEIEKLNKLLENYKNVFSENGPPTSYAVHHIDTGPALPISTTPYRLSITKREILKQELDEMIKDNIIEESESPWASPVVLVPKKDETMRVCIDYRRLNAITKPDRYPLPRIDDLLHEAKCSKYMSTIDLKAGYWQIIVNADDQEKTAFISPFGLFQFKRLPFGLRNAPATFQRCIDRLKNCLTGICILAYLDDIIILSTSLEQHMTDLEKVFIKLIEYNLRANRRKSNFCCQKVKYLGHIIGNNGIMTDPDKIAAIKNREPPNNVKQLMSFLQTCSWYRRFIQDFSKITEPLSKLTRKNIDWIWTDEQQTAFDTLKNCLSSAPILKQADENEPFIIKTDASAYAIGAMLAQGTVKDEHPIEYASRLLTAAERNYSTIEREALAVVWATSKFRGYIDTAKVTVVSDHQPLKWLMTLKSPTGRLARWALQLQPYNLDISYTPGRTNLVADTLSRPPCNNISEDNCTLFRVQIDMPRRNAEDIRTEQLKDADLKIIIDCLESVENDESHNRWTTKGYFLNNGVLYKYPSVQEEDNEDAMLMVPTHEQENIIKYYHDEPTAGHFGVRRTTARILSRYFWKNSRKDIAEYVGKCLACQRYKALNFKPAGLLQSSPDRQRFEVVAVDLFGPLPSTKNGNRHILIIEDLASRWTELFALKEATADNCSQILLNEIFLRYGICRRIISDNGPQFISAIFQKLTFCLGIKQSLIPVFHPESNPVERKNRDLKTQLAILVGKDHTTWDVNLAAIRFAMNSAKCESTSFTPAYLTFGRELVTYNDIQHNLRAITISENFVPEITPRLLQLADTLKIAREVTERSQDHNQQYLDKRRRPDPKYQPGDKVLITTHVLSNAAKDLTSKFVPKRDGPYIILCKHGPASYKIADPKQPDVPMAIYHTSALTQYKGTHNKQILPIVPLRRRGRPKIIHKAK